jgi:hypothetical protein
VARLRFKKTIYPEYGSSELMMARIKQFSGFLCPYWFIILWHVDPLLGKDKEISNYTTAIAK